MPLSRGATLVQEETQILILVGYASKHGATREIAQRSPEILTLAGRHAEARPVQQAGDLGGYGGVRHRQCRLLDALAKGPDGLRDEQPGPVGASTGVAVQHRPARRRRQRRQGVDLRTTAEIEDWARSIAAESTQLDAGHVEEDP
jgi:hypothetical protein